MSIKSSQTLVSEALKEVKTITVDEAFKLSNEGQCSLIDIREKGELDKTGRIENSNHIPRGMLEFWLDPQGPYFKITLTYCSKATVNMRYFFETHFF